MLEFLDPKNVLEHLIELLLAQNQLGGCTGCHPGLLLAGILLATVDGVELGHPGAQHGLLAEAVDLGQAAHPLLDVLLEDLPRVVGGAAPALHHAGHAVALQEDLGRDGTRKACQLLAPGRQPRPALLGLTSRGTRPGTPSPTRLTGASAVEYHPEPRREGTEPPEDA